MPHLMGHLLRSARHLPGHQGIFLQVGGRKLPVDIRAEVSVAWAARHPLSGFMEANDITSMTSTVSALFRFLRINKRGRSTQDTLKTAASDEVRLSYP